MLIISHHVAQQMLRQTMHPRRIMGSTANSTYCLQQKHLQLKDRGKGEKKQEGGTERKGKRKREIALCWSARKTSDVVPHTSNLSLQHVISRNTFTSITKLFPPQPAQIAHCTISANWSLQSSGEKAVWDVHMHFGTIFINHLNDYYYLLCYPIKTFFFLPQNVLQKIKKLEKKKVRKEVGGEVSPMLVAIVSHENHLQQQYQVLQVQARRVTAQEQ